MRVMAFMLAMVLAAPATAQDSKFQAVIEKIKTTASNVCENNENCLQTAISLGWFLWNNREKKDVHIQTAKCVGVIAYKQGYVMKPLKVLEMKTKEQFVDVSVDICDCIIASWGKSPVCRQALLERDQESVGILLNLEK